MHANGNVIVYGTRDASVLEVHADRDVNVYGTVSATPQVEFHTKKDAYVHEQDIKSNVDVYATGDT